MDVIREGGGEWGRWNGVFRNDDIIIVVVTPSFLDIDKGMVWEKRNEGGWNYRSGPFSPLLNSLKPPLSGVNLKGGKK